MALIEECRKFVRLVEFFGTPKAPKLEVRIVHLLFMLDYVTGLILRRYYFLHSLVLKAGDDSKTQEDIDREFLGFKDELRKRGKSVKGKIYQPKHDSAKKMVLGEDVQPTLIGFNELENSELLQGSSLLKSLNNSRNDYSTHEDVNALMDSSFLVNTIEAMKDLKQKRQSKNQTKNIKKEGIINKDPDEESDQRNTLGSLKKQIVGNLYQYYDSKEDRKSENYFDISSKGEKEDLGEVGYLNSLGNLGTPKDITEMDFTKTNLKDTIDEFANLDPEDKVSDIDFGNGNPNQFIEIEGDTSEKQINKNLFIGTMDKPDEEEIDFNLTKNMDTDEHIDLKINPLNEYGQEGIRVFKVISRRLQRTGVRQKY